MPEEDAAPTRACSSGLARGGECSLIDRAATGAAGRRRLGLRKRDRLLNGSPATTRSKQPALRQCAGPYRLAAEDELERPGGLNQPREGAGCHRLRESAPASPREARASRLAPRSGSAPPCASSSPPPRQLPWIAAITGLGAVFHLSSISCRRVGSAVAAGVPNSRMSAPAEKWLPRRPVPRRRPPDPPSRSSSARASPTRTACERPFTGGLSKVTTATRPCSRRADLAHLVTPAPELARDPPCPDEWWAATRRR